MQQPFLHVHMDFPLLFPSLFVSLERLKDDPYEAGWVLGCINDMAGCFIRAYVRTPPGSDVNNYLSTARAFAQSYLRAFNSSDLDIGQLLDVVQMVHTSHTQTGTYQPSPVAVDDQLIQEDMIMELDDRFAELLDEAVVKYMYDGETDRIEFVDLAWGWNDAQEIDDEDISTHLRVQYIPDETPTEYIPCGPKIPLHDFSAPYTSATLPDATSSICCESFEADDSRPIVLARCVSSHIFHGECLGWWVNESAMANANTCPIDRAVLCVGRGRVHPTT
ncbi:hypothetical protein CC86DRAFT_382773 [Ophiobolus disseminans]|uniref:RING-type domain-containing protein n=1 Tax=Ophiobolus disseminans TaxID=1469910 RepID=A0A6A6ZZB3_9PLEO|nr:hypothetical protein CC86DRAFT_382773 [Ophiobolus disseminans]